MPRISITEENRAGNTTERFAQLKLDTGEKARFVLYTEPWGEWVHELRAPVLEDGVPVMEERKRKDGSTFSVNKMEFIRRSICLGDLGVLADKGIDPAHCPACDESQSGDVEKAVQRFAAPVLRYTLRGGTWAVMDPFSATVLVWPITAKKWDELISLHTKLGDLKNIDLTLDCEDGHWQRNTLSFETEAAWKKIPGAGEYIKRLLAAPENLPTEDQLRDACGSPTTLNYMRQDVDRIKAAWQQVRRAGSPGSGGGLPASAPAVSLDGGLDSLLNDVPAAHPGGLDEFAGVTDTATAAQLAAVQQAKAEAKQEMAAISGQDPFAGLGDSQPFTQPAQASPAPAAAPETLSFDDVFKM